MTGAVNFVPAATTPVRERITKVGGQPVWCEQPQWPLSTQTGHPMVFLAQFDLGHERTAYLFMTGDDDGWVDGTYEADGGENAIIIQPEGRVPLQLHTSPQAEGPGLSPELLTTPSDRATTGPAGEVAPPGSRLATAGTSPVWLQGDETPGPDWRFIAQIDSRDLPFTIGFGDMGVGYAFLSPDGTEGRFLWQSS